MVLNDKRPTPLSAPETVCLKRESFANEPVKRRPGKAGHPTNTDAVKAMSNSIVTPALADGSPADRSSKFQAGVRPYAADYYVPDYVPSDTDLLCAFRIQPAPGVDLIEASAAVAAESSTGTWTEVWSNQLTDIDYFKAKVYRIEGDIAYLAYPMDLFEENSVVNIMSSIVGNVFGFKAVSSLRLEDMRIPVALVKTFPGPNTGIYDERVRLNKWGRPLLGGTVKPKLGLSAKDYAKIIYECLAGGLDTTKDDENMNSQPFNRWRDRFRYGIDAVQKAEAETAEAKGHFFNVTAGSTEESLRRLEFIASQGSRYIMYDFLTAGFTASADVFSARGSSASSSIVTAMHAVFTRQKDHGIHMRVVAKWLRLTGGDHLHTGTVVGKLEGSRAETLGIVDLLRQRAIPADPTRGLYFEQDFAGLKATWPVASGGIHVLNIPDLYAIYGNDAFWLFGGGTHGHPRGSRAGAQANRAATEAVAAGKTLQEAARTCLRCARRWNCGGTSSSAYRGEARRVGERFAPCGKLAPARRWSYDQTASDHSGHCRRQRRRKNDDHAGDDEYPQCRLRHSRLHGRLSQVRPQGRAERCITPLHPDCNYIDVLEQHLERLHYGQPILKPVYEHSTGTLARPEYVQPRQFVIVEGLLGFSTATMREFYDVKVYLDPPENLRKAWKIKRDTAKRGYTTEQVLAELERREPDSRDFIRPQREYADIVVRFFPPGGMLPEPAGQLNVRLVLRPTIPHPDLTYLVEGDDRPASGVRLTLARDEGGPVDVLEIDGDVAAQHADELEDAIWQHLPDLRPVSDDQFGAYQDQSEVRHSSPLALAQLLVAYHLLRKYGDLSQLPFASPVSALSRLGAMHRVPARQKA